MYKNFVLSFFYHFDFSDFFAIYLRLVLIEKRMIIPSANPIRFNIAPPKFRGGKRCYIQKFQQYDTTKVQILIEDDAALQDWTMQMFDFNGVKQQYQIERVQYVDLVDGYTVVEFTIDFSRLPENLYYLYLFSGKTDFYSDLLCIKEKHENTYLINYSNSVNDQEIIFSTGITFNLRIELEGRETPKSFVPNSVKASYSNDMGGFVTLFSNPYATYQINIGSVRGIPDYLIEKVNRAFGCDTLLIDGISINLKQDTEFEETELEFYPLRSWIIEIVYNDDNIGNNQTRYLTAQYLNPVCQKVDAVITYLVAEYTNPVCQREEATITYPSAQYTQPVCQKRDDSFDFATAEWTEPVCQLEEDTITMRIHLAKTSSSTGHIQPNQMTILWKFSEDVGHFETGIFLHAEFSYQSGGILIKYGETNIEFTATGTTGSVMQTIDDIDTLISFLGAELIKINPDSVNGKQIAVWITIN
jgi:hypothetical protein